MKQAFIYILLSLLCNHLIAQADSNIALLRQYDNISAFERENDYNKSLFEKIKSINISAKTKLSFGGSFRNQIESYINEEFQNTPNQNNTWLLQRIILHAHLKIDNRLELFAGLNSSLQEYKRNPSPVDVDRLGVGQLFIKYNFGENWAIGIGRESMRLGTGRLVDSRDGPNLRLIFDKVQFEYNSDKFKVKAFFSIPVTPKPGMFDNNYLNSDKTLSGLYTTSTFSSSINWDAYLFYIKSNAAAFNEMTESERRYSIGIRYFGKWNTLSYNNEFVYQSGKSGNREIRAWAIFLQIENELNILNHSITLGLKSAIISGDKKKDDNTLNTFNAMYPRGAYFGKVARFGSANLINIHPYINSQFKKLSIEIDYAFFWRYSTNDGIYNAALNLNDPSTNTQKYVAHQPGIIVKYTVNKYINFEFESNAIFPRGFLNERNQRDNLYHFVFASEFRF